jgi:hypothetical protein
MKKITAILIFIIIAALAVGAYFLYRYPCQITGYGSILCPTRPITNEDQSWKTYTNTEYGFEMKYPADFFDPNQQPRLFAGDCNYQVFPGKCPNINDMVANDQAAEGGYLSIIESNLSDPNYWDNPDGEKQTINNVPYCLYTTSDAETGHVFNYYYFTTVKNQKCLGVYLAVTTVNCDFYLPLEEGNTEQAKNYNDCVTTNKNQPKILNEIISSFKFNK